MNPPYINQTSSLPSATPQIGNNADFADFDQGYPVQTPFPLNSIPWPLQQMALQVASATFIPIELPAMCALAAVSAAIGGGLKIDAGGTSNLGGNLFFIGVAPSGVGKGQAFKAIMDPIFQYEASTHAHWLAKVFPGIKAREAAVNSRIKVLEKECGKPCGSGVESPALTELASLYEHLDHLRSGLHEHRYTVENTTAEALAKLMAGCKHEAIASLSSEARGCVDVLTGRYSLKTDESIYLAGFSSDPCSFERINRPTVRLMHPCLSVCWLVQPDKFQELLNHKLIQDSGLWPRFLIVNSKATLQKELAQRPPIDASIRQQWTQWITGLLQTYHDAGQVRTISVSTEIHEMFRAFGNEFVDRLSVGGDLADIASFGARWKELAWRLSLVIHAGHWGWQAADQAMDSRTANCALTVMKWFIEQQLSALSVSRDQRNAKRLGELLALLLSKPGQLCTLRDMKCRHGFSGEEMTALAAQHPDRIAIGAVQGPGAGRPSHIIKAI